MKHTLKLFYRNFRKNLLVNLLMVLVLGVVAWSPAWGPSLWSQDPARFASSVSFITSQTP